MCRDWTGDHEIRADEEAEYAAAMAEAPPKPEFSDSELEEMNQVWQNAMRGCVAQVPLDLSRLPNIDEIIRHNRGL